MHGLPLRRKSFVCTVITDVLVFRLGFTSMISDQFWSVYSFIWKNRPDTSSENDTVSQAAAMTHFSTSVLGVFFPCSVQRRTLSSSRDFRERVPVLVSN